MALVRKLSHICWQPFIRGNVPSVDCVMSSAINAGGKEITPAKDYEYGYRQGEIQDPFGHRWLKEKKI